MKAVAFVDQDNDKKICYSKNYQDLSLALEGFKNVLIWSGDT
jgi:hypothetical protein